MWDYVPTLIGVSGALMVVGIYWKLKKGAVAYVKLLRIAQVVALVLSLLGLVFVPFKSSAVLIWSLIAEFVLCEVIVRLGSRLKKSYNEFRMNPQYYFGQ